MQSQKIFGTKKKKHAMKTTFSTHFGQLSSYLIEHSDDNGIYRTLDFPKFFAKNLRGKMHDHESISDAIARLYGTEALQAVDWATSHHF